MRVDGGFRLFTRNFGATANVASRRKVPTVLARQRFNCIPQGLVYVTSYVRRRCRCVVADGLGVSVRACRRESSQDGRCVR